MQTETDPVTDLCLDLKRDGYAMGNVDSSLTMYNSFKWTLKKIIIKGVFFYHKWITDKESLLLY